MKSDEPAWWEEAVVYQVYPRSFADSDGDGIGDLEGVHSRLPYLADLGVDAIWLTPFYPSPLADGGYDVSDYCEVDSLLGTLADFDALVEDAAAYGMRVIIDLVPNHCSVAHPLFRAALAAGPGSRDRSRFIFRDGRGRDGDDPPNDWLSMFGGPAWSRVQDGQWYLHLFDAGQPDWNWRDPDVPAFFAKVIRFWLDRGAAGLRIDVAQGLFKDPDLPDAAASVTSPAHSAYFHRPELHALYRSWREILDSYPVDKFPGPRTAVGEVWSTGPEVLLSYLAEDELPQVFNFQLLQVRDAAALRAGVDAVRLLPGGSRAPWVMGNHDRIRLVTRFTLRGGTPRPDPSSADMRIGARCARAAALLLLALPGSAYIYQGDELGLPEVFDLPADIRTDPRFRLSGGEKLGRDGCRVPLPWTDDEPSFGFSGTGTSAPPWLPQPADWGHYSVAAEREDPGSFLNLYRSALRLRRSHPALGRGDMCWLDGQPAGLHCFAREPGFTCAVNFGEVPGELPPHTKILLASEPVSDSKLPPFAAAWLAT